MSEHRLLVLHSQSQRSDLKSKLKIKLVWLAEMGRKTSRALQNISVLAITVLNPFFYMCKYTTI